MTPEARAYVERISELEAEVARLQQERIARLAFESVYADVEFQKIRQQRDELLAALEKLARLGTEIN